MNTNTQMEKLRRLSPREFAELIGVSKFTVYKMIRERVIPYIKLGMPHSQKQRILIDPASAMEALERRYNMPARP